MCTAMNTWLANITDKAWKFSPLTIMFLCGKIFKKCFSVSKPQTVIYTRALPCNKGQYQ